MDPIKLMPVSGGQPISGISPAAGGQQKVAGSDPTGFGEVLKESIDSVDQKMKESAALTDGLVSGKHSNIHETMIAMEKSSLSFRMLTKVQTKVIDAYKEVMRMQL